MILICRQGFQFPKVIKLERNRIGINFRTVVSNPVLSTQAIVMKKTIKLIGNSVNQTFTLFPLTLCSCSLNLSAYWQVGIGYLLRVEMDQEEDDTLREEMGERRVPMAIIMEREIRVMQWNMSCGPKAECQATQPMSESDGNCD